MCFWKYRWTLSTKYFLKVWSRKSTYLEDYSSSQHVLLKGESKILSASGAITSQSPSCNFASVVWHQPQTICEWMSLSHSNKTSFTKIGDDRLDWACDHSLPMPVLSRLNQKYPKSYSWTNPENRGFDCRVYAFFSKLSMILFIYLFRLYWVFSSFEEQALGCVVFSSCSSPALEHRLSSCGSQAQLFLGRWDIPGPGIKPECPTLAGRFFTTESPGKPESMILLGRIT